MILLSHCVKKSHRLCALVGPTGAPVRAAPSLTVSFARFLAGSEGMTVTERSHNP